MINRRTFLTLIGLGSLAAIHPRLIQAIIAQGDVEPIVFYVSPNGNDTWSGEQATPNADGRGPFATITKARDTIRQLKFQQNNSLQQPITVYLRGGTYYLSETLIFTAEDSGTESFPITYKAYDNETVILSGGQPIRGWRQETVNGRTMWTTTVENAPFKQLWVDNQRRYRARKPKQGYLLVDAVPDVDEQTPRISGQSRFQYSSGDLQAWPTVTDGEVVLMNYWTTSHLPVSSVDESREMINFSKNSIYRLAPGRADGSGASYYYIENVLELIDTPGEWYISKAGKLYYLPLPGENPTKVEIVAPNLSQVVRILGASSKNLYVEHLRFEGLTFAHSEWYFPPDFRGKRGEESGFRQAASGLPGAVYVDAARYCIWQNCTVAHASNYGIEFVMRSHFNQIDNCQMYDLGGGGVKINLGCHDNQVAGCHLHDLGVIFHGAVGVWIASDHVYNNRIANCHIHDLYYSGISMGWRWDYGNTKTNNNIIEFNHIHHIGRLSHNNAPIVGPILNDKGGIYTLGEQPGATIRGNRIHDVDSYNYAAWAIYLDQASSHFLIENNLAYDTRDGGFHLHYGRSNIIRNNIFAFGEKAQIKKSTQQSPLTIQFEQNIIYWEEGELLGGKWNDSHYQFDRNVYWHIDDDQIRFDHLSWQQWQAKGMDKNSIIADPLFVNARQRDFRLQPHSPALELGFQPLEMG